MTKEQLAAALNGNEYGDEMSAEQRELAKRNGLVVVYGASDDLIELDGAIRDEAGGCGNFKIRVVKGGIAEQPSDEELDVLEKFGVAAEVLERGNRIHAIWDRDGISWQYETDIPHATFDIMEDGQIYCRGIVFSMSDL